MVSATHAGTTTSIPATIGDKAALELIVGQANVRFPQGIAADARTVAFATLADGRRPRLDEIQLELALSDGRVVRLPGQSFNEGAQSLELAIRPPRHVPLALALLALVAVLWIAEAIPLFATSLLVPVVLVVAGVQSAEGALAPFFHPIIALFLGGFLMAEAMKRVGLDRRLALLLVSHAGSGPIRLYAAFLGVSAFASMWMSNTAATALLVPIALAVTAPLGASAYRKTVVLGIAYAATLGGVGSAIGTPANPMAIAMLDAFGGRHISFAGWFAFGLPMVVVFLPVLAYVLWRGARAAVAPEEFALVRERAAATKSDDSPTERRAQRTVLFVFLAVMAAWLGETWHGVDAGIVALAGTALLALLGRLQAEDIGRISWGALVTFGGGLALGRFLVSSGASDWMALGLGGLAGFPAWVGVGAMGLLALGLTSIASNTATAAMLIPLAIPLAGILGVDPALLVCVVAIASSLDFAMVVGTPPTMIAYSTGLFTAGEIFRAGILLDLLGAVVLLVAVVGLWHLFGIV